MEYFADQIPLMKPWIDENEFHEVEAVLKSGWLSLGPKVRQFEEDVAKFVGAPHAVATNSATSAIHLAFKVSGLQQGDKVIVPAHTCMATVNGIVMAGGVPVFADIDPKTFNLDPIAVERAIASDVRGLCIVHQIGLPADLERLGHLSRKHDLVTIEDAATAFGASYKGRRVGAHGNPTVFSWHPRKMITTGEGGMVILHDSDKAERARVLRSAGASISDFVRHQARGTLQQVYPEPGYNYRMTDIQAAIGIAQLRKVDRMLTMRKSQAEYYNKSFDEIEGIQPPYVPRDAEPCYSSYCVTIPNAHHETITGILNFMAAKGVSCRRGIQSLCREPYFSETHGDLDLPETDMVARTTLFLPIFPGLTEPEQERVVSVLAESIQLQFSSS